MVFDIAFEILEMIRMLATEMVSNLTIFKRVLLVSIFRIAIHVVLFELLLFVKILEIKWIP